MSFKNSPLAIVISAALPFSASAADSMAAVDLLLTPGNQAKLTIGIGDPEVSGSVDAAGTTLNTNDIAPLFDEHSVAVKMDVQKDVSFVVLYDRPSNGMISYHDTDDFYPLAKSSAEKETQVLNAILKINTSDNLQVFGGVAAEQITTDTTLMVGTGTDAAVDYTGRIEGDIGLGYVAGVAFNRPETATQIVLSYNSAIDHNAEYTEFSTVAGFPAGNDAPGLVGETTFSSGQVVTLKGSTAVSQSMVVFASATWGDGETEAMEPKLFKQLTGAGIGGSGPDSITYEIGVGKKINDKVSLMAALAHEPSIEETESNLAPVDGSTTATVAAVFSEENSDFTVGVRYKELDDTVTETAVGEATFEDNSLFAIGASISYHF